jgi:hypothetical protein
MQSASISGASFALGLTEGVCEVDVELAIGMADGSGCAGTSPLLTSGGRVWVSAEVETEVCCDGSWPFVADLKAVCRILGFPLYISHHYSAGEDCTPTLNTRSFLHALLFPRTLLVQVPVLPK